MVMTLWTGPLFHVWFMGNSPELASSALVSSSHGNNDTRTIFFEEGEFLPRLASPAHLVPRPFFIAAHMYYYYALLLYLRVFCTPYSLPRQRPRPRLQNSLLELGFRF